MKAISLRCRAVAAGACCAVMAGCGSSSGTAGTVAASSSAASPPPAATVPAGPLGPAISALQKAGFTAEEPAEPGHFQTAGPALAEIRAGRGPLDVVVSKFAAPEDAGKAAKEFKAVVAGHPDQIQVRVAGDTLFVATVEEPAKVPARDFAKVMSIVTRSQAPAGSY